MFVYLYISFWQDTVHARGDIGSSLSNCLFVCFSGCLSVWLSAQNFHVFLRNRLADCDEIFTIGGTTHEECFRVNYDVIGHVV